MFTVSRRTLKLLAALIWHIGALILLLKARGLLLEAGALRPDHFSFWIILAAGLILGGLKARFLFSHSCRKNMSRIAALKEPRLWQFYRPRFFLLLTLMILTGSLLSRLAQGHFSGLVGVATLDLSIAIALLGSSIVFWQESRLGSRVIQVIANQG